MSIKDVLKVAVAPGEVVLAWINSYSSIVVMTHKTKLIFDPVRIGSAAQIQADAIVITHEHLDHFDPHLVAECQAKLGIPVLTTPFVAQRLPGKAKVLSVGDSVSVGDIELFAERCDHPANEPLSFVISAKSAATIYHPGDSQPFPEVTELREKYRLDVLLYSGTSVENAIEIAKLIKPPVIVSYYNDRNWAERFRRQVSSQVPQTEVRLLRRFETWRWPVG